MKKIAIILLSVVMLMSFIPVYADEVPTLVVLGDSIATGYGLSDYNSAGNPKSKKSFSTLLAAELELKQINYAHDGDTTTDLINKLSTTAVKNALNEAKVVCVSIGGNNFLRIIYGLFESQGKSVSNIEATIASALEKASVEVGKICMLLKENAVNANVYFQTLYNPYMYWTATLPDVGELSDEYQIPNIGRLCDFCGKWIDKYNDIVKIACEKNGIEVVDVNRFFEVYSEPDWLCAGRVTSFDNLDNINLDPHPTENGHYGIYKAYTYKINDCPIEPNDTTDNTTDIQTDIQSVDTTEKITEATTEVVTEATDTTNTTETDKVTDSTDVVNKNDEDNADVWTEGNDLVDDRKEVTKRKLIISLAIGFAVAAIFIIIKKRDSK